MRQQALTVSLRRREASFTLVELIVVMIVIGILVGVGLPSYLSFQNRAERRAAEANVRAAIPSISAFFADNDTYAGMTYSGLQGSYDAGLSPISFGTLSVTAYCVESTVGANTFMKNGPAAAIVQSSCP